MSLGTRSRPSELPRKSKKLRDSSTTEVSCIKNIHVNKNDAHELTKLVKQLVGSSEIWPFKGVLQYIGHNCSYLCHIQKTAKDSKLSLPKGY